MADLAIEDGFGEHTAGQAGTFVERLREQELPSGNLDRLLLSGPEEAEAIERIAKETFDHATYTLRPRLFVSAPEWPGGPVDNVAGNRLVPCGTCGRLHPREPYVTRPLGCYCERAQNGPQATSAVLDPASGESGKEE